MTYGKVSREGLLLHLLLQHGEVLNEVDDRVMVSSSSGPPTSKFHGSVSKHKTEQSLQFHEAYSHYWCLSHLPFFVSNVKYESHRVKRQKKKKSISKQ